MVKLPALLTVNPNTDPNSFPIFDKYTGKALPKCSQPVNYGAQGNTLVQTFDSGHEQRRQKGDTKRTFEFQYNALRFTEYITIRDFFFDRINVKSFLWTDPMDGTVIKVRFNQDALVGANKYHGPAGPLFEVQMKLIQTWD